MQTLIRLCVNSDLGFRQTCAREVRGQLKMTVQCAGSPGQQTLLPRETLITTPGIPRNKLEPTFSYVQTQNYVGARMNVCLSVTLSNPAGPIEVRDSLPQATKISHGSLGGVLHDKEVDYMGCVGADPDAQPSNL